MKKCRVCKKYQSISEFHCNRSRPDGLRSTCKTCRAIARKKPERFKPQMCPQGHPLIDGNLRKGKRILEGRRECLTCHRVSAKKRYWKKPEDLRALGRKYQREHKAERLIKHKEWRDRNADHVRSYSRFNKATRRIGSTNESMEFASILLNDPCSYCGGKRSRVIDHIHPISKGGDSHWLNLTGSCDFCNGSKHDKNVLQFLLYQRSKMVMSTELKFKPVATG